LPVISGEFAGTLDGVAGGSYEYLPGSDFAPLAMNNVFTSGDIDGGFAGPATINYTGSQNMAMFLRWQNLSATPEGVASIINLIWTDLSAGAVVGTMGVLGAGNAGLADETVIMTVSPIVNSIKYHSAFGTPAYIPALVLVLAALFANVSAVAGQSSSDKLRTLLHQSSSGRIFTTILVPENSYLTGRRREWIEEHGNSEVDVSELGQVLKSRHVANGNEEVAVVDDAGGNTQHEPRPALQVEENITDEIISEHH
jgi:hypothetical protein